MSDLIRRRTLVFVSFLALVLVCAFLWFDPYGFRPRPIVAAGLLVVVATVLAGVSADVSAHRRRSGRRSGG